MASANIIQAMRAFSCATYAGFLRQLWMSVAVVLITGSIQVSSQASAVNSSIGVSAATPGMLQVKLRLNETVSSANARVGQPISLQVIDPVLLNGKIMIDAGAQAFGSVTTARKRGRNHREGQLVIVIRTVTRPDGTPAPLLSATAQKGSGRGEPIFGPCTFPFPADPAGLFRKGNDVVITKGTEVIATLAPAH